MTNQPKSKKTILPNGLRVVSEWLPSMLSVAVGVFVGTGPYSESEKESGLSHFIEHMTFKGTPNRTAKDIAVQIDDIGGKINAYTGKEYTCFYTVTLDKHFDQALDILADMFNNSLYAPKELERESKVILEEIKMYEDTPDENIHDFFVQTMLGGSALGRPILGTSDTVSKFRRKDILNYRKRYFTPDNIIISAAGDVWHSTAVNRVKKLFGHLKGKKHYPKESAPEFKGRVRFKHKKTEQVHLCLGTRGVSQLEDERYPYMVLDKILGGSMSSRLFQEIREKRGLVYSVFSTMTPFHDSGVFYVYAGTSKENMEQVIDIILKEFKKIKKGEISKEEIAKTREYIKGNLVLGLEGTSSRMNWMGRSEFYYGKVQTINEVLKGFDNVNVDDLVRVANVFFQDKYMTLTVIGDIDRLPYKEIKL